MRKVDLKNVRVWVASAPFKHPFSLNDNCPTCHHIVNFSNIKFSYVSGSDCFVGASGCPNCNSIIKFFCLQCEDGGIEVYIYPSGGDFSGKFDLSESVPEPLRRAFQSTLKSYNAGIYTATAATGRRTLEGVFKYLLPDEDQGKTLYQMIELVAKTEDLSKPLLSLAHAIRGGGNLGAHFDVEREPDAEVARKIVELLGFLIDYLYVLPRKIELLELGLSSGVGGGDSAD